MTNLPGWWRVPLRAYSGWRGMFSFAFNTNLNGTVNIFVRDNIPLVYCFADLRGRSWIFPDRHEFYQSSDAARRAFYLSHLLGNHPDDLPKRITA